MSDEYELGLRHEIQGGGATAVIFGNYPDATEIPQVFRMLSCPAFAGAHVRIMPDHHAGAGCLIGFTCPVDMSDPKIVPNVIGVDIGCGVQAIHLPERVSLHRQEHFLAFDRHLRQSVPSGFSDRQKRHPELRLIYTRRIGPNWDEFEASLNRLIAKIGINPDKAWCAIGSLGGGNHFIEVGEDSIDQSRWLTVHSGSRNFGLQVCRYHQNVAKGLRNGWSDLAWLEGEDALDYLADMRVAQTYARLSREVMLYELTGAFKMRQHERLNIEGVVSVHNYIDGTNLIRKGAISAHAGERVLIPWNMRDGIVMGIGKGNPDWNESAPHGAGRKMSRGDAKRSLVVADFERQMEEAGVWTSCVGKDTLDEAPDAYKDSASVEEAIADTVTVERRLRPIYNFKASEERK